MKDYIEERTIEVANYIIENKSTVRAAAKYFNISKSTIHKDVNERTTRKFIKQNKRQTKRPHKLDSGAESRFDTVVFLGAEVLRRKIGNTVSERRQRCDHHVVQLDRSGIPRHDCGTEAVDNALNRDITDRDKALLQNTRDGNDGKTSEMPT